jgi:hypothetical protein
MKIRTTKALLVVLALILVGACGGESDSTDETAGGTATEEASTQGEVSFAEPEDGAEVSTPVKVKMEAKDFTIEPAGEVREGAGHFHIMVDTECVAAGQVIPNDATHVHFGKAQTEAELPLPAGEHELCLQAADGAHTALDLADTITVQVKE